MKKKRSELSFLMEFLIPFAAFLKKSLKEDSLESFCLEKRKQIQNYSLFL